jgi:hypothetical protein
MLYGRPCAPQVLLIEHDIPTREFSSAVMACLPSPTYSCAPEKGSGREDLRHLNVCSIDPPGCKVRLCGCVCDWVGGGGGLAKAPESS